MALAAALALWLAPRPEARGQQYTEHEVKAGYIYNFARFVKWPAEAFDDPASPIVVGVYGNARLGAVMERIALGASIDGRKVVVKYYNSPQQIEQCHILFASDLPRSAATDLLRSLRGRPILTVGDNLDGFCQEGGIINFLPQNARNRFEINNAAAANNELAISSKLLLLAKIVNSNEVEF